MCDAHPDHVLILLTVHIPTFLHIFHEMFFTTSTICVCLMYFGTINCRDHPILSKINVHKKDP